MIVQYRCIVGRRLFSCIKQISLSSAIFVMAVPISIKFITAITELYPGVIEYNIKKMKYEWCTHPRCDCYQYYNKKITYEQLKDIYKEEGSVCYESAMLNRWTASAGWDNKGKNGDRPRRIIGSEIGSLAVLTLVTPNSLEYERRIFALFLIDEYDEGNEEYEGYVASCSKYKLHFTRGETNDLQFWDYYVNENTHDCKWSSGLFRYLSDIQAAQDIEASHASKAQY